MKKVWNTIKDKAVLVSERAIRVSTAVLLTIAYLTVFGVTAIILKILGKKQLIGFRRDEHTYWVPRPAMKHSTEETKRQY